MKVEDLKDNIVVATTNKGMIYKGNYVKVSDEVTPTGQTLIEVKLKIPVDRKKDFLPLVNGDSVLIPLSKCLAVV